MAFKLKQIQLGYQEKKSLLRKAGNALEEVESLPLFKERVDVMFRDMF